MSISPKDGSADKDVEMLKTVTRTVAQAHAPAKRRSSSRMTISDTYKEKMVRLAPSDQT